MLTLPDTLSASRTGAYLQEIAPQLQQASGPEVRVDASALQRFDSSALALLLECQRRVQAQGKQLVLQAAPERLQALAQLYGVAELLHFAPATES